MTQYERHCERCRCTVALLLATGGGTPTPTPTQRPPTRLQPAHTTRTHPYTLSPPLSRTLQMEEMEAELPELKAGLDRELGLLTEAAAS